MPCVSVIVPTYNRAHVISQTLQSVVNQTFSDWECIVVDDGSTDDTAAVVQPFVAADPRFRLIRQANANAANARNRGVAEARGEFLDFLDSDDLFEPDKLEWQVQRLRADPAAVLVYGDSLAFYDGDPSRGDHVFERIVNKPQGPPPIGFEGLMTMNPVMAPLVRTKALRDAGGFDVTLGCVEDWDMWLALARRGTVLYEKQLALRYRRHSGPSGNKSANSLRNYQTARQIIARHMRHVPLWRRPRIRAAVRDYWRRGYGPRLVQEANQATNAGDWPLARQVWRALVGLDPSLLKHHHVRVNFAWALLPTQRPPIWRRWRAPNRVDQQAGAQET